MTTTSSTTHPQPLGGIDLVDGADGPVLRLRGEIDTAAVDAWAATGLRSGRAPVAVDVSATTFMDCRGLRLVVRETEAVRRSGRIPELRRPSTSVRRLVDIAGAAPLFATVA